jgi:hypothetical protein
MASHGSRAAGIVLAAAVILSAADAVEPGDEALSVTGEGRVALSLDGSGYFREIESGQFKLGLRWPGPQGSEFFGGGGLLIRFVAGDGERTYTLGPEDFETVLQGQGLAGAAEGCTGGKRYPAEGCDDDGDGAFDEDPLDGRDNDGDGEIDEDFAAVGDRMIVTSTAESRFGLRVTRRHHVWNYGHVRDFIGFSTTIEYLPPEGGADVLRRFELLHLIDFDIGAASDYSRGRDDRALILQRLTEEGASVERAAAVATSGEKGSPFVAVVIFSASGPNGPLASSAEFYEGAISGDSLWSGSKSTISPHQVARELLEADNAEIIADGAGDEILSVGAAAGDIVLAHRIGTPFEIVAGGRIELEWAIVFGRDRAALMRNISRARETWEGVALPEGGAVRWIVPARRAARVRAEAALTPVWVQGEKVPAVAVDLPALEIEEVEWLRVAGKQTDEFETVGGRIVITVDEETISSGPFAIDGQLTDGTIFRARVEEDELRRYAGESELQPGRLPDDSLRLFPNPFVDELSIDVLVHDPSTYTQIGASQAARSGISSVSVYDVKGRLVRTILAEEVLHPGEHVLGWDGTDEAGTKVSPGVYYCRLQIGERSLTRRVILLR